MEAMSAPISARNSSSGATPLDRVVQQTHRHDLLVEAGPMEQTRDLDNVFEEGAPIRPRLRAVGPFGQEIGVGQQPRVIDPLGSGRI